MRGKRDEMEEKQKGRDEMEEKESLPDQTRWKRNKKNWSPVLFVSLPSRLISGRDQMEEKQKDSNRWKERR